jgi:membrane fusion protein (multidrug efflux system)
MPQPFSRTLRAVDADRFGASIVVVCSVLALLSIWLGWFFFAHVSVYAISQSARLEVNRAVHPVGAPASGRIAAVKLKLGDEVRPGDVILELASESQKLQLQERKARLEALGPELQKLYAELRTEERAQQDEAAAAQAAMSEIRARSDEAAAAVAFAQAEADRATRLQADGLLAQADFQRTVAELQKQSAAAATLRRSVERLESDQKLKRTESEARLERLRRDVAAAEGQVGVEKATAARAQNDISERSILAPVAGRIGEMADLRVGAVVREGDLIATIVPAGELLAVADFIPSTALGRIRVGQSGRLRLQGFPWTQYGTVPVNVSNVASEARDGFIRVELQVHPKPDSQIPFQHGLPGTVEVEVSQSSPAALVLRASGQLLSNAGPRD